MPESVSVVLTHWNPSKLKRSQIVSSDEWGLVEKEETSPLSLPDPARRTSRAASAFHRPHWPRAWNRLCLMKLLSFQKYRKIPIFRLCKGKKNWFEKLHCSTESETTFAAASSFREVWKIEGSRNWVSTVVTLKPRIVYSMTSIDSLVKSKTYKRNNSSPYEKFKNIFKRHFVEPFKTALLECFLLSTQAWIISVLPENLKKFWNQPPPAIQALTPIGTVILNRTLQPVNKIYNIKLY